MPGGVVGRFLVYRVIDTAVTQCESTLAVEVVAEFCKGVTSRSHGLSEEADNCMSLLSDSENPYSFTALTPSTWRSSSAIKPASKPDWRASTEVSQADTTTTSGHASSSAPR